jgi:hypothetical protein
LLVSPGRAAVPARRGTNSRLRITAELLCAMNTSERTWAAPTPLFHWEPGRHARAISSATIRRAVKEISKPPI